MEILNTNSFISPQDAQAHKTFLDKGYIIQSVEDDAALARIRSAIVASVAGHLGVNKPDDEQTFLDMVHERVDVEGLNALRLAVIEELRRTDWFRPAYYALVRGALASLVGNELAMQRGVGLNVQLPQDTSSLLPIHADVWDGDSPFEVVVWLPLVDCYKTKSMYIVPMEHDREIQLGMANLQKGSAEDLFQEVAAKAEFLKIDYGQVLLFTQTLMHGNRLNVEAETRWTMNCRFKSLFSPYADKRLGEFFEPITMRPATRIGTDYRMPDGFNE